MMKAKNVFTFLISGALVLSCGQNSGNEPANADGFEKIENQIKSEFGNDAYFTEISITYNESIGNIVGVTATTEPESMQMGQWNLTSGDWQQNSDITIEIPEGTKAADFMFQLGTSISLRQLGELVEKSKESLKEEKQIDNARLHMAFIKYPDTGEASRAEYVVMLQPETGGTTFTYSYKLDGELIGMDY